ncbi:addiction module protein [Flavobacterium sp. Fl-77]|uniref:Addiction module protein n=1 Tax=Flavobacterium flavipigmentatum TaxID=2893884 RepID=A0AAJ2S6D4_9FLAO|nr:MULTISPECIES: addiction module protein [unclassified Flavobacterium]MDX6180782.1 addiction module protein [Flavobacterium sp. Fl-33]MDX6184382.1 addiction module protein [Flavobacterium sp. Fl-77]UFH39491.1 addiction module protein [Flavobacterium sp. F-70]
MESIKLNINLSVNQLVEAVKQLSPKDRLKINDAIWNDNIEIPIEHQEIVLNRIAKAKTNPERLLDWDEVSKKL